MEFNIRRIYLVFFVIFFFKQFKGVKGFVGKKYFFILLSFIEKKNEVNYEVVYCFLFLDFNFKLQKIKYIIKQVKVMNYNNIKVKIRLRDMRQERGGEVEEQLGVLRFYFYIVRGQEMLLRVDGRNQYYDVIMKNRVGRKIIL